MNITSVDESIKFLRSHCDYTGVGLEHVDNLEKEIVRLREGMSSISNMIGMHLSYGITVKNAKDIIYDIRNSAEYFLKGEETK